MKFTSQAGLSPGMIVDVFQEPYTESDFEGKGKLIWIANIDTHIHDNIYLYEYWRVELDGEVVYRWIKGRKRK